MLQQACPRGHLSEGKICLECGYVFPLELGASVGPFTVDTVVSSRADANLYLISRGDQQMALWECRELYQAGYRDKIVEVLSGPIPNLMPILGHFSESDLPGGPLLYFIQPAFSYQEGQSLEQLIQQGPIEPDKIKRWISQILLALQEFESKQFCYNAIASSFIQIHEDNAFLSFPAYGNFLLEPQPLSLKILQGFSPPEGIRSGLLYRETDRFGLAMVLFHMLTGLSPSLWYPDVPKLKSYQYLWGKGVVQFFKALLSAYTDYSTRDLILMLDKVSLTPTEDLNLIWQESQAYYHAVKLARQDKHIEAAEKLVPILEGKLVNPFVFQLLGDIHWQRNEPRETALAYGESIRREQLGSTYLKLAKFYLEQREPTRASKALRRSLKYIPYDPEPYCHLARIDLAAERYLQAENWLNQSIKIRPTSQAQAIYKDLNFKRKSGNTVKKHRDGFAVKYHHWDRDFEKQIKEHHLLCPDGHPQFHEFSHCSQCQRPMHLRVGEQIKTYTIQEVLVIRDVNHRHNSSTYRAHNQQGQDVLIKEIQLDRSGQQRVAREIRALKLLDHPSVPVLLDEFRLNQRFYIVQTFQTGEDLEDFIRQRGPLPEVTLRLIVSQALDVLAQLEKHELIHSDIKPKNLLWDANTQHLCLLDFDVSVLIKGAEQISSIGFTEHYSAYEQRYYGMLNHQSDGFSLGLTLLYLMTGLTPELFKYHHPELSYQRWEGYAHCSLAFQDFIKTLITCFPSRRTWHRTSDLLALWQDVQKSSPYLDIPEKQTKLITTYYELHQSKNHQILTKKSVELMKLRPDSKMNFLLGRDYAHLGSFALAEVHFKASIVLDPDWPYAYWELANIYRQQKEWGKAIEVLTQALEKLGDLSLTCLNLARCYRQVGAYKEALLMLQRAERSTHQDLDILLEKAHLLTLLENYEAARLECEKVLDADPKSARAYQLLMMIKGQLGLFQEAIELGQRAVYLDPDNPLLHYDLGLTYFRNQQFVEAILPLLQAVKLVPDLFDAYYFIGSSQIHLGQYSEARHNLKIALNAGKDTQLIQEKLSILDKHLHSELTEAN